MLDVRKRIISTSQKIEDNVQSFGEFPSTNADILNIIRDGKVK